MILAAVDFVRGRQPRPMSRLPHHAIGSRLPISRREEHSVVRAAPSSIVRLSTRDVAPADRLSYANWILSSSLAPSR